ncbi:helix-turn-helix domain-containing protein [Streptomyces sp. NPDC057250]|uniref:helix-turn-helix domain-containing protein n=1 Tax=Streptomyces sp. NPDC057250 TaxID=3346068 RepID=UPI0036358EF8
MARLHTAIVKQRAREAGDSTTNAIARRAGVRESTLNRLFNGTTKPSLDTLVALRGAYAISLDDLVQLDADKAPA